MLILKRTLSVVLTLSAYETFVRPCLENVGEDVWINYNAGRFVAAPDPSKRRPWIRDRPPFFWGSVVGQISEVRIFLSHLQVVYDFFRWIITCARIFFSNKKQDPASRKHWVFFPLHDFLSSFCCVGILFLGNCRPPLPLLKKMVRPFLR